MSKAKKNGTPAAMLLSGGIRGWRPEAKPTEAETKEMRPITDEEAIAALDAKAVKP